MSEVVTVLDALFHALASAAAHNPNEEVAPAAVLWTDGERKWEALLPRLRAALPHLLTLGSWDPAARTGPAIWLKCMLARTLPDASWPEGTVPVVYLPGVSRAELRAVEECPPALQPIAELQHRGVLWSQVNGKDWTPLAFLKSGSGGLGLDVAQDTATIEALGRALDRLAGLPVAALCGRHVDAAFLDDLMSPDKARRLLEWMGDPPRARAGMDANEWAAFAAVCRKEYSFDPEKDGEIRAAELLGSQSGAWAVVWQRFAEAPRLVPGLPDLLRRACPKRKDMFFVPSSWPQENERAEVELRGALEALDGTTQVEAARRVAELGASHGERRGWVWADLGQAPLAISLESLAGLAQIVEKPLPGATAEELARAYASRGWAADAAVMGALEAVRTVEDQLAVTAAVRALYLSWASDTAERLQAAWKEPAPSGGEGGLDRAHVTPGSVIVFVDGLRFDLGQALAAACRQRGWTTGVGWRWAPLPSVTATAKPAAGLIAGRLGPGGGGDFVPTVRESGKPLTPDRFLQLHQDLGVVTLGPSENGDGTGAAWTECGSFDHHGHDEGAHLAWRIEEDLQHVLGRIAALLAAGWKTVHVVTDHGWVLVPGGLAKTELPAYLTEIRGGRCATLRETSEVTLPTVAWSWDSSVRVAIAPGLSAFTAGREYAHGGLSLQECVLPELMIRSTARVEPDDVQVVSLAWAGLRCKVRVTSAPDGAMIALRSRAGDQAATLGGPRVLDAEGIASVLVADDSLVGVAAFLVVLGADGRLLTQRLVTVGERGVDDGA